MDLDGRILPNLSPKLLMSELRGIAGPASEIEVLSHGSGLQRPDLGLFETLSDVLKERDADGIPVPMLMPAATDGRLFARFGIQTYGFLPNLLRETLDFAATIHGSDERVPVGNQLWGRRDLPPVPKVRTHPVVLPGPCLSLFDVV